MDPRIKKIAMRAMYAVGNELYRRWDYREKETRQPKLKKYVQWRWRRYCNKALNDQISRLCRDPERKLKRDDRLIGAINYLRRYAARTEETDQAIVDILTGVVAAIEYAAKGSASESARLYAQVAADLLNIDSNLLNRAKLAFALIQSGEASYETIRETATAFQD
jgi:mannitol-1-phosphate 5-dehydrogenase